MALVLYLSLFAAGTGHALWRAFSGVLFGEPGPPEAEPTNEDAPRPLRLLGSSGLSALAAGGGGAGALLHLEHRMAAPYEALLALAAGLLIAFFVLTVANGFLDDEPRA